jgi:ABC-type multidrug transport system fused ATPase/permease subunit
MEDGSLAAAGTHTDLLNLCPVYAEIVNIRRTDNNGL